MLHPTSNINIDPPHSLQVPIQSFLATPLRGKGVIEDGVGFASMRLTTPAGTEHHTHRFCGYHKSYHPVESFDPQWPSACCEGRALSGAVRRRAAQEKRNRHAQPSALPTRNPPPAPPPPPLDVPMAEDRRARYEPSPFAQSTETRPLRVDKGPARNGEGWGSRRGLLAPKHFPSIPETRLAEELLRPEAELSGRRTLVLKSRLLRGVSHRDLRGLVGFTPDSSDQDAWAHVKSAALTFVRLGVDAMGYLPIDTVETIVGASAFATGGGGCDPCAPSESTLQKYASCLARVMCSAVLSAGGDRTELAAVTPDHFSGLMMSMTFQRVAIGERSAMRDALISGIVQLHDDADGSFVRVCTPHSAVAHAHGLLHGAKLAFALALAHNDDTYSTCAQQALAHGGLRGLSAPSELIRTLQSFNQALGVDVKLASSDIGAAVEFGKAGRLKGLPTALAFNGVPLKVEDMWKVAIHSTRLYLDSMEAAIDALLPRLEVHEAQALVHALRLDPRVNVSASNGDGRVDFAIECPGQGTFTHDQLCAAVGKAMQASSPRARRRVCMLLDKAASGLHSSIREHDVTDARGSETGRLITMATPGGECPLHVIASDGRGPTGCGAATVFMELRKRTSLGVEPVVHYLKPQLFLFLLIFSGVFSMARVRFLGHDREVAMRLCTAYGQPWASGRPADLINQLWSKFYGPEIRGANNIRHFRTEVKLQVITPLAAKLFPSQHRNAATAAERVLGEHAARLSGHSVETEYRTYTSKVRGASTIDIALATSFSRAQDHLLQWPLRLAENGLTYQSRPPFDFARCLETSSDTLVSAVRSAAEHYAGASSDADVVAVLRSALQCPDDVAVSPTCPAQASYIRAATNRSNLRSQVFIASPGSGKSLVMFALAHWDKMMGCTFVRNRILVVQPTNELANRAHTAALEQGLASVNLQRGASDVANCVVVVVSYSQIASVGAALRCLGPTVARVVFDEAHHQVADAGWRLRATDAAKSLCAMFPAAVVDCLSGSLTRDLANLLTSNLRLGTFCEHVHVDHLSRVKLHRVIVDTDDEAVERASAFAIDNGGDDTLVLCFSVKQVAMIAEIVRGRLGDDNVGTFTSANQKTKDATLSRDRLLSGQRGRTAFVLVATYILSEGQNVETGLKRVILVHAHVGFNLDQGVRRAGRRGGAGDAIVILNRSQLFRQIASEAEAHAACPALSADPLLQFLDHQGCVRWAFEAKLTILGDRSALRCAELCAQDNTAVYCSECNATTAARERATWHRNEAAAQFMSDCADVRQFLEADRCLICGTESAQCFVCAGDRSTRCTTWYRSTFDGSRCWACSSGQHLSANCPFRSRLPRGASLCFHCLLPFCASDGDAECDPLRRGWVVAVLGLVLHTVAGHAILQRLGAARPVFQWFFQSSPHSNGLNYITVLADVLRGHRLDNTAATVHYDSATDDDASPINRSDGLVVRGEIQFQPDTHKYYIRLPRLIAFQTAPVSVTGAVSGLFPFDAVAVATRCAPIWRRDGRHRYHSAACSDDPVKAILGEWDARRDVGTSAHAAIDALVRGAPPTAATDVRVCRSLGHARSVLRTLAEKGFTVAASEVPVYYADGAAVVVAGCIDLVLRNETSGSYVLADWKTSCPETSANRADFGVHEARTLPNDRHHRYSAQLSLYQLCLENCASVCAQSALILNVPTDEHSPCEIVPAKDLKGPMMTLLRRLTTDIATDPQAETMTPTSGEFRPPTPPSLTPGAAAASSSHGPALQSPSTRKRVVDLTSPGSTPDRCKPTEKQRFVATDVVEQADSSPVPGLLQSNADVWRQ